MGRMYSVTATGTTSTSALDLLEIIPAADQAVIVHAIEIVQTSDAGEAESEMLGVKVYRASTSGSGGSSVTPARLDIGDAAASMAVEGFNTTVASGTTETILNTGFNVQAGFYYRPSPEERIVATRSGASDYLVIGVDTAPQDGLSLRIYAIVEEIGT